MFNLLPMRDLGINHVPRLDFDFGRSKTQAEEQHCFDRVHSLGVIRSPDVRTPHLEVEAAAKDANW
jgi:hypothetical protein